MFCVEMCLTVLGILVIIAIVSTYTCSSFCLLLWDLGFVYNDLLCFSLPLIENSVKYLFVNWSVQWICKINMLHFADVNLFLTVHKYFSWETSTEFVSIIIMSDDSVQPSDCCSRHSFVTGKPSFCIPTWL